MKFVQASALFLFTISFAQERGANPPLARISTISLAEGRKIEDVLLEDVDGNGVADLVVASSGEGARRLEIHLRHTDAPAFTSTADASLDLPQDVVAFAVADVHADPGREIVLFNASGAFVWRPRAKESERITKLFACEFLWQIPDAKDIFHWQAGVADIDGDGLDDLALPGPDSHRIALQRRAKDGVARFETIDLDLPHAAATEAEELHGEGRAQVRQPGTRRSVSISFEGGSLDVEAERKGGEPLVSVRESVPAAQLVDWDGDGDLDVLAMTPRTVFVFVQEPRGHFDPKNRLALDNPVVADRERELDVAYNARTLDIDGDRRADCIIFASDKRAKDVRTQVQVFVQGAAQRDTPGSDPLFGAGGVPRQLLVIGGFARPLRYQDVDGDGRKDLVLIALKPDLIDEIRAASSERLDADLYVYKNVGGSFSKRPDLAYKLSVPAQSSEYTADFIGDVTGDGISELLVREDPTRIALYRTQRTREGLGIAGTPLWEMSVDAKATLLLPPRLGPGSYDLFAVEGARIVCASFR